jgi:BCD family chlorophyll transporter-like MFS transporter
MKRISQKIIDTWVHFGPRFLPFADVATDDLPLSRLLRLSLFQFSVGIMLVLLVGTLNRVMIVPLLFAPFRALIGYRSDTHRSHLGWRRVPYMWMGTMLQFGGLSIMPFALLVLSGAGQSSNAPAWIGQLGAAVAFLLVGAGVHITQTVGLALANDLVKEESQPKVVGLMYVMMLVGMIVSALIFGELLSEYSPGRLIQVIQGAAIVIMVLNVVALWKQECRDRARVAAREVNVSFSESWGIFCKGNHAIRRLLAVGLGTMAFTMEDILLEPYGGEILNMSVGATTSLTATLAIGGLLGFGLASHVLGKGYDAFRMAMNGAFVGLPAFLAVILAAPLGSPTLFAFGILLIGFGSGLFGHGTLTATMRLAPKKQSGLALGAWGAVQATAAGTAIALGGVIRDLVSPFAGAAGGYIVVYIIEIILLLAAIVVMLPLIKSRFNLATNTA